MRSSAIALLLSSASLLSTACLDNLEGSSELDDTELLESVPRQPLPLEGSPTAYGMLRVANELSYPDLDRVVGLDRRAAQSIRTHLAGDDLHFGTPDDRFIDSVATLDELYWLGEENLWLLQRHALLEGFVPEQVPEPRCTPALVEAIESCIDHTTTLVADEPSRSELEIACLVQSEPQAPSAEHFAALGLAPYDDPWMGYFAQLCPAGAEDPDPICELGVAGIVDLHAPACDALYDEP